MKQPIRSRLQGALGLLTGTSRLDAAGALGLVAAGATRREAVDRLVPVSVGLPGPDAVFLSDPGGG
jgi:hypothetical protein